MNPVPTKPAIHPADELSSFMERIYRYRMTTTSGGNLSIRDDSGSLWITPSQKDKGSLTSSDIVYVRANGEIEGKLKPSSEYPFHQQIYQARPDIQAIVHAHPVALVAFSICSERPDTRAFARSHAVCGQVGFAPYACPGSTQLGANIAAVFAQGANCVMLENHGVVVGGANLQEAFERFETLEYTARVILKAKTLGAKIHYLSDADLQHAAAPRTDGPTFEHPFVGPTEKGHRETLCQFVQRGYRQRLLTAAQGSYSMRLEGNRYLITPVEVDRATIRPDDLVLVDGHAIEAGKVPSRSLPLHAALYRKYPEVNSVVIATPPNATAFSITQEGFDSRTIPESYIFLRTVQRATYRQTCEAPEAIAELVTPRNPTALLENSGVLVTGRSVLDAFDRLEVLESTADALVNARIIGPVNPMNDAVIDELEKAFF